MLFAFTDESYSDAHYYQAALVADEEVLARLDLIIGEARQYIKGFGIENPVEFHGNEIMSARKGWELLGNDFRKKSAIFKFILRRVAQLPVILIIQGVDVKRLKNRYSYPDPPHEITYRNLLDALDRYAENEGKEVCIIADKINSEAKLSQLFDKYKLTSTGGPYPRMLQNIIQVEHVDSHLHSGIQIVDLCAFLYRRFDEHEERSEKTRREVVKMWEILQPNLHPQHPPRVWRP